MAMSLITKTISNALWRILRIIKAGGRNALIKLIMTIEQIVEKIQKNHPELEEAFVPNGRYGSNPLDLKYLFNDIESILNKYLIIKDKYK